MVLRPVPHKFTISSTLEGSSTALGSDIADFGSFGYGFASAMIQHKVTGSTLNIAFKAQGSIGQSGIWTDLMAATTGSTAGGAYNSTVTATFDRLRLNVTANATTGDATLTAWVAVR